MSALLAHIAADKAKAEASVEPLRQSVELYDRLAADARADLARVLAYLGELDDTQARLAAHWNGTANVEPPAADQRAELPAPKAIAPKAPRRGQPIDPPNAHLVGSSRGRAERVRAAVAAALAEAGDWTGATAIAAAAGVGPGAATKYLQELADEGLAEHNGKGGAWSKYRPRTGRSEAPASSDAAERPNAQPTSPSVAAAAATSEVPPDLADLEDDDGVPEDDAPPAIGDSVPQVSPRVRKLEQQPTARAQAPTSGDFSRQQHSILNVLKDAPLNPRELAQGLVANVHDVGADLRFLVASDLIRARGDGSFELKPGAVIPAT